MFLLRLAAAAAVAVASCGPSPPSAESDPSPAPPPPLGLRRIDAEGYAQAVTAVFGPIAELDPPSDGMPDADHLEGDAAAARAVAATASRLPPVLVERVPCLAEATGPARPPCIDRFIEQVGRLLYRRALSTEQRDALSGYAQQGALELAEAVGRATEAMLQSPYFLYRDERPGLRGRLSGYGIATRLSFFLTGGPPDDALLAAAERGDLETRDGLLAEAERWLDRPAAAAHRRRRTLRRLGLDRLATTPKSASHHPRWADSVPLFEQEAARLIDRIGLDGDRRQLWTSSSLEFNAELAQWYGLEPTEEGWARYDVPGRSGLLTTSAFLGVHSPAAGTSPSRRGLIVRERLLCSTPPPPPSNVASSAATDVPLETPGCRECHRAFEPFGQALESFDAAGRAQPAPVSDHEVADLGTFRSASDMARLLVDDPRFATCLASDLTTEALGYAPDPTAIDRVAAAFREDGHHTRTLYLAIVTSDEFRGGLLP